MFSSVSYLAVAIALLWVAPLRAQAPQDWLAALAPCAGQAVAPVGLSLLYPAPGLPAVVTAGALLRARAQLPAALTPPPGVQQERALLGWHAELSRQLQTVGSAGALGQRYTLPVTSVRPDGASSLVYRVALAVPAYAAPGTYSLSLRTPFGERRSERAVQVLDAGALPRLAWLPSPLSAAAAGELESLPVDVWLAQGPPAAPLARPVLLVPSASALALRAGKQLLESAADSCKPSPAFADELALLLATERRERSVLALPELGPDRYLPWPGAQARPLGAGLQVQSASAAFASWQLSNQDPSSARELALLLPVGQRLAVQGASIRFYPASDVSSRHPAAIVAQLQLAAGASAQLRAEAAPAGPRPWLRPGPAARSGGMAVVQVLGAAPGARVAFDFGFARSAFDGPKLEAAFATPGAHPIAALVIAPDGMASALHAELWVETRRPPSCAVARLAPRGTRVPALLLFAAGMLLKRRRARGFGNRLRPRRRCPQRGESPVVSPSA